MNNKQLPTNQPTDLYIEPCTFVKTVLMLIVVLYHSILFWGGKWFSAIEPNVTIPSVSLFAGWLATFHVYGFVLTSGYLYSYLRYEKNKYQCYGLLLRNKALRLLIPYVFVSVIWAVPIGQVFFHLSLKEILNKYLLGISPSQLWFLLMLFWVFVIVWPFSNKIHSSNWFSVMFAVITYVVGILGGHLVNNYFQIWTAFQFILFFVIGMKLRDAHCKMKLLNPRWYILGLFLIVHVMIYVLKEIYLPKEGVIYTCADLLITCLLNIVGSLLAFFILQTIANIIRFKRISNSKWFMLLAKSSMIIYLFHQQLIYISIAIFNTLINPYINMLINFVFAIIVSVIFAVIFTSNRYLSFLVGEKSKSNVAKQE